MPNELSEAFRVLGAIRESVGGFLACAVLVWLLSGPTEPVLAQEPSGPARITVKFVEGLEIRLSEGQISGRPSTQPEKAVALQRRGLDGKAVDVAFTSLNTLLKEPGVLGIKPLFSNEASGVQPEGPGAAQRDLRLYYKIALKDPDPREVDRFVARLQALPIVETAYRAPIPEDPGTELPVH